jgi:hypothetical protein
VRRISYVFEKKKEGQRTHHGWYRAIIIGAIVIDHDKASPSFQRDCDKGGWRTRTSSSSSETSSSDGTTIGGCSSGTVMSYSSGGRRRRPCGTGTYCSSSRTVAVTGCDSETSTSPTHLRFALGTSSSTSLTYATPNSSFIISNVICKNHNIPKYSHSRERGLSIFEKKGGMKNLPIGVVGPIHHGGTCASHWGPPLHHL